MIDKYRKKRIYIIYFFFLFNFFFLATRLIYLQFLRAPSLVHFARNQYQMYIPLQPVRGTIFDRNTKPLALNLPIDSVFADPKEVENPLHSASVLSGLIGLDKKTILDKFAQDKSFVWLARHVDKDLAQRIKSLSLKGIYLIQESKRNYPQGKNASTLLGFCGIDNQGLEGLELFYDQDLKGRPGYTLSSKDAKRRRLFFLDYDYLPPVDGYDLILSIDSVIQHIAERELEKEVKDAHALAGSVVVMDPATGEILAMANYPNFDPNHYQDYGKNNMRNRAITDMFEPGSTFKIITASAALEQSAVDLGDRFFCENGSYNMKTHVLHDHRPHGWLTFREIIELSSNIGTVKVAQKLGLSSLYRYIHLFGVGKKTGVDLPGEAAGFIRPLNQVSKTSIGAVPIGQEIMVNALQLTTAISVIANGGSLMRPFIVKEIRDKKGVPIKTFSSFKVRDVISPQTARKMKDILIGVVETGTGQRAGVENYQAAGKTGTAQKVENGSYSHNKFTASFIGFIPAEHPELAIGVILDEPHPYYYGGVVCAPVFKNIAADALQYLDSVAEDLKFADIQHLN